MCYGDIIAADDYQMCRDCEYTAPVGSHDVETPSRCGESDEHKRLKKRAVAFLRRRGYRTQTEYWCKLSRQVVLGPKSQRYVRIDVVGYQRGRPTIAIECGNCCGDKLELLTRCFREVWHWTFDDARRQLARSDRFTNIKINCGIEPPYVIAKLLEEIGA